MVMAPSRVGVTTILGSVPVKNVETSATTTTQKVPRFLTDFLTHDLGTGSRFFTALGGTNFLFDARQPLHLEGRQSKTSLHFPGVQTATTHWHVLLQSSAWELSRRVVPQS